VDITFFETFGNARVDGECTAIRESSAELAISNDTLLNAVADRALCLINGCDYILQGPSDGAVWSGMVNPGTKRQREVRFAELVPVEGKTNVNRIVIVHGALVRGEAILDVRVCKEDQKVNPSGMVCFTQGCNILTAFGDIPVEHLKVGDLIHTVDNGLQPIRWIGSREITRTKMQVAPQAQPVRIKRGAFGPYMPAQDIWVSQQHQMLLETDEAHNLFSCMSVLAPAKALVNGQSILLDTDMQEVKYMHLMFDEHQVVFVDGIPSESFYPSPGSLMSLTEEDRQLVFGLMPNLESHPMSYGPLARPTVPFHQAQMLAA
jgi:hypothetical protein